MEKFKSAVLDMDDLHLKDDPEKEEKYKYLSMGRVMEVIQSVREQDYGIERGAQKLNVSEEEFKDMMDKSPERVFPMDIYEELNDARNQIRALNQELVRVKNENVDLYKFVRKGDGEQDIKE